MRKEFSQKKMNAFNKPREKKRAESQTHHRICTLQLINDMAEL